MQEIVDEMEQEGLPGEQQRLRLALLTSYAPYSLLQPSLATS